MMTTNAEWRDVQFKLRRIGHSCMVTGEVDERTRKCIRNFQANVFLEPTGIVDSATEEKINRVFINMTKGKQRVPND